MTSLYSSLLVILLVPAISPDEKQAIAQREQIQSFELKLRTSESFADSGASIVNRRVWMDGSRVREDRIVSGENKELRQIRCFDGTDLIYWNNDHPDFAVHRFRSKELHGMRERGEEHFFPVSPRLLGLVLDRSYDMRQGKTRADFRFHVGMPERADVGLSTTKLGGKEMKEIKFTSKDGVHLRLVFDPDQGGNPVLFEIVGQNRSVRTDYEFHTKSGQWFPKKVVYHSEFSSETRHHEEVTLEVVSLNEPIDPKVFKFDGMDLPIGVSIVSFPREGRGSFWDGNTEVAHPGRHKKAAK